MSNNSDLVYCKHKKFNQFMLLLLFINVKRFEQCLQYNRPLSWYNIGLMLILRPSLCNLVIKNNIYYYLLIIWSKLTNSSFRNAVAEENKKLLHRIAQLDDDLEEEQNEALRHLEKSKKLQQLVIYFISLQLS